MRASRILVFLTALGFGAALPSSAQTVHGTLLDTSTGAPIVGARVSLRTADGDLVRGTLSGDDGAFRLTAPGAGDYHIHATRIGYLDYLDGPVPLAAGEAVEIRFELSPQPVSLDAVTVTAAGPTTRWVRHLDNAGFYRRKQTGLGHFVERREIERRRPQRITDLLRGLPGVQLIPDDRGLRITMRGGAHGVGGLCSPRIYLDGFTVPGDPDDVTMPGDPDDVIIPEALEAIEVYRGPAETPAQYGGVGSACGVILLWSQR